MRGYEKTIFENNSVERAYANNSADKCMLYCTNHELQYKKNAIKIWNNNRDIWLKILHVL